MLLEEPHAASPNHSKERARPHAAVYLAVMGRYDVIHADLQVLSLRPNSKSLFIAMSCDGCCCQESVVCRKPASQTDVVLRVQK